MRASSPPPDLTPRPPRTTKDVIVRLLRSLGSRKEVEQYLKQYSEVDSQKFAVIKVGGNILSSQVDLQGTQVKDGFISVTANCDIEQPALQQLLYNLESGMPFLFVDQLVVQVPTAASGAPGGAKAAETVKMHVLISVSGQWLAAK